MLFSAQRLHRIDKRGPTRGNKIGSRGNNCQQTREHKINSRTEWVDFEENVSQSSCNQDSEQQSGGAMNWIQTN